jgi:hypothetical protein
MDLDSMCTPKCTYVNPEELICLLPSFEFLSAKNVDMFLLVDEGGLPWPWGVESLILEFEFAPYGIQRLVLGVRDAQHPEIVEFLVTVGSAYDHTTNLPISTNLPLSYSMNDAPPRGAGC